MTKVFIDGSAGTAGLRIHERIAAREDIELISVPYELRRDINARKDAINSADVAFLCLPDEGSVEAVGLVENPDVAIIDTSTAHRTAPGWEYGFPELAGRREKIKASKRVANPGCRQIIMSWLRAYDIERAEKADIESYDKHKEIVSKEENGIYYDEYLAELEKRADQGDEEAIKALEFSGIVKKMLCKR